MKLLDLLEKTAKRIDLGVEEPQGVQPPPGFEWVRDVVASTPFARIVVRVFGSERDQKMVLTMPIGFSDVHRKLLGELPANDRAAFLSKMYYSVVMMCPRCRVGFTGVPQEPLGVPEGIVAEIRYVERPGVQQLADDIIVLINVFFLVNALLAEKFPGSTGGQSAASIYT